MNFDEYFDKLQKTWQSQPASAKLPNNVDAVVLLKQVQRDQQLWGILNLWDAILVVGSEFLGALFFSYLGARHATWTPFRLPDWDFLLLALAGAGVGIFRLVNHIIQRRKKTTATDTLKACIEASLNEVNHDIWLQRNVFWWYWLPLTTAFAVSFCSASLRLHAPRFLAFLVLFVIPLSWWGCRLNYFTLRKVLEPRRQELETLLTSLK